MIHITLKVMCSSRCNIHEASNSLPTSYLLIPDLSIVLFLKFRFMSSNAMIFVYSNDLPKNVYEMIIAFCPHLNKYF